MEEKECTMLTDKHVLVCLDEDLTDLNPKLIRELEYIKKNFCGLVYSNITDLNNLIRTSDVSDRSFYLCCGSHCCALKTMKTNQIFIIRELIDSRTDPQPSGYKLISIGQVPLNVHNQGVFFKNFFDSDKDYFDRNN